MNGGVARGFLTEEDLMTIHTELTNLLAAEGVTVDALYYCPHLPEAIVPAYKSECTCRKPQPGMLLQAADDWGIDLFKSWMVGDSLSDLLAGKNAGCFKCVLVNPRAQEAETLGQAEVDYETCEDMNEVAQVILKETRSAE